jgi:ketosteroid isomerase-like protein
MAEQQQTADARTRILAIYADYAARGPDCICEHVTEDVVWRSAGGRDLPWAGEWRGHEGVRGYFATLADAADIVAFEVDRVIAEEQDVVVLARVTLRWRSRGFAQTLEKADVVRLRGGLVAEFREFYDTGAALSAFAAG